jgi:putative FmdB family regulatory protein
MPIYAYRCSSCGHAKDVLQKVSDPLLTVCPSCGAEAFQKQLTAAGFQLKGSGWYVTDFRGGASAGAASAPSGGDSKPDAGAGSADGGAGKGDASGGESKASAATAGGCGTSCACH